MVAVHEFHMVEITRDGVNNGSTGRVDGFTLHLSLWCFIAGDVACKNVLDILPVNLFKGHKRRNESVHFVAISFPSHIVADTKLCSASARHTVNMEFAEQLQFLVVVEGVEQEHLMLAMAKMSKGVEESLLPVLVHEGVGEDDDE